MLPLHLKKIVDPNHVMLEPWSNYEKIDIFESAVFIEPSDEILKWHKCNINLNIWRLICIMFATSGIVVQSIT